MALNELAKQLRQKKTELMFRDSRVRLLGLAHERRAAAVSAMEGMNSQIAKALETASGFVEEAIEDLYQQIVATFAEAMNAPAGDAESYKQTLNGLQTQIRQLPETRTFGGRQLPTGYGPAKGPLAELVDRAGKAIEHRATDLRALGERLGMDPRDVTDDDVHSMRQNTRQGGVLRTGANDLLQRFDQRASGRSGAWRFMSNLVRSQVQKQRATHEGTLTRRQRRGDGEVRIARMRRTDAERDLKVARQRKTDADMSGEPWTSSAPVTTPAPGGGRTPQATPTSPDPVPSSESPTVTPLPPEPPAEERKFASSAAREAADRDMEARLKEMADAEAAQEAVRERRRAQPRGEKGRFVKTTSPTAAPDTTPTSAAVGGTDTATVLTSIDETLKSIKSEEEDQSKTLESLATLAERQAQDDNSLAELREDKAPDFADRKSDNSPVKQQAQSESRVKGLLGSLIEGLTEGITQGIIGKFPIAALASRILGGILPKLLGGAGTVAGAGVAATAGAAVASVAAVGVALKAAHDTSKEVQESRDEIDTNVKNLTEAQKKYAEVLKNLQSQSQVLGFGQKTASIATAGYMPDWMMPATWVRNAHSKYVAAPTLKVAQRNLGLTDDQVKQVHEAAPKAAPETQFTRVVSAGEGKATVLETDDGRVIERSGVRGYRNNNPGNIKYGKFAQKYGAIGTDGVFAIFPTADHGRRAKQALLFSSKSSYANLSVKDAVARYAPPSENPTAVYQAAVLGAVGSNKVMKDLTPEEQKAFVLAIEQFENGKNRSVKERQVSGPMLTQTAPAAASAKPAVVTSTSPQVKGDAVAEGRAKTTQNMAKAAAGGQTDAAIANVIATNRSQNITVHNQNAGGPQSIPPPVHERLSTLFNSR